MFRQSWPGGEYSDMGEERLLQVAGYTLQVRKHPLASSFTFLILRFEHLAFGFWICLGFRASDFGFILMSSIHYDS
jgi:hypothetical protein